MASPLEHQIETTWINSWVEDGLYVLHINETIKAQMLQANVFLPDINHVLKTGSVVVSDMIDNRGLWDVRGKTVDDELICLTISVNSNEFDVELLEIVKLHKAKKRVVK